METLQTPGLVAPKAAGKTTGQVATTLVGARANTVRQRNGRQDQKTATLVTGERSEVAVGVRLHRDTVIFPQTLATVNQAPVRRGNFAREASPAKDHWWNGRTGRESHHCWKRARWHVHLIIPLPPPLTGVTAGRMEGHLVRGELNNETKFVLR